VASSLNLFRNGAAGFIAWLDGRPRSGARYLTFVTLPSAITVHGPPFLDTSAWYV
jgi:hypothetical protein